MQAFVLAGGMGTRLQPLTLMTNKVMLRVIGKPFLEYLLLLLKKNGITDMVISVGYLASQIRNYFNDGSYWGLDIKYSFEQIPIGTGGALRLAGDLLEDEFFFINGDTYLDIDYQEMSKEFRSKNTRLMMAICKAEKSNCRLSERLNYIDKYSKEGLPDTYIDAGVWILRKNILDVLPDRKNFMIENYIQYMSQSVIRPFISEKRFIDIGTFESLEKFKREAKEKIL